MPVEVADAALEDAATVALAEATVAPEEATVALAEATVAPAEEAEGTPVPSVATQRTCAMSLSDHGQCEVFR